MNISQSAEESTGMARIERVVVPGLAHHVTKRGDRRELVFFDADDYRPYRRLAAAPAYQSGPIV
jgi:putative transposase